MKELVLVIWLGLQSMIDLKYKEIPIGPSLLAGIMGIGFCVFENRPFFDVLWSCLPGLLAMAFSWISKEVMGYGDGLVLVIMGIYLPISQMLSIGLQAFSLAGVVALVLLVVFHRTGKSRLPFVPFLGLVYGCEVLIQWGKQMV